MTIVYVCETGGSAIGIIHEELITFYNDTMIRECNECVWMVPGTHEE